MDTAVLTRWNTDPSIIGGIVALAVVYVVSIRRDRRDGRVLSRWAMAAFVAALAALVFALDSPLDALSDLVFFSAHMIQHLLLLMVVPVLLLASFPSGVLTPIGKLVRRTAGLRQLGHPIVVSVIALGAMWIWHAPTLYETALHDEAIHAMEHLCFLATATVYWWPVVRPNTCPWRMPDPLLIFYLFGGAVGSCMLAALLTFAPTVLYSTYADPASFASLRTLLGLTPQVDQQVGGLLMWVAGGMWYFGAAIAVFAHWFSTEDREMVAAPGVDLEYRGVKP